MRICQEFDLPKNEILDNPDGGFIAGMECEIEAVIPGQQYSGFTLTEDGSLRNNGVEYISNPMPKKPLLEHFKFLHASLKYTDKKQAFSPRTSTHVHVNCRHLTLEEVKNIVMLYALFEEVFFQMVNPSRRHNIHCVPLTDTHLPSIYNGTMKFLVRKWHKYTALNVLPLAKIGTIEFRHMQGTDDEQLIGEWLTSLENLWNLGKVIHISKENLSDERVRMLWYDSVFGHSERLRAIKPAVPNLIKNSVIDVKMSLIGVA